MMQPSNSQTPEETAEQQVIASYRDLVVWQKAVELTFAVYEITAKFPREEIYGLVSQMRRAAVSIASNIAEGRSRGTRREFRRFLFDAYGSGAELETQVFIAKNLPFGRHLDFSKVERLLTEVMRMLNSLIAKLAADAPDPVL